MIKKTSGCGNFVYLIIFIAGAAWLGLTLYSMQQAKQSASWPSTTGKVDRTWVEESSSTDDEGHVDYSYTPHVRYAYTVDGTQYTSERISFGAVTSYGSDSSARSHLSQYPPGGELQVFYDPADPSKAVLLREAHGSTVSLIGSGVLLLISIFGGVGALFQRIRRPI